MRIGIVSFHRRQGGPSVYAYHLINELIRLDTDNQYFIFTDQQDAYRNLDTGEVIECALPTAAAPLFFDQFVLPGLIKKYHIDIIHHTKQCLPLLPGDYGRVVTIHDVAPHLFPDTFSRLQGSVLRFFTAHAARSSDMIITDSVASQKDIAVTLGVRQDTIMVIPLGVDTAFSYKPEITSRIEAKTSYALPDHYFLSVCTLQPRKNVSTIITAYDLLLRKKDIPHHLVIAGRKGWLFDDLFRQARESMRPERIHFLGDVPRDDLPAIYQAADIFITASSYEGFGLTTLEAMAAGCAVIGADVSATPEVIGDAGVYFSVGDASALGDALDRLISDELECQRLSAKAKERAYTFPWRNCAQKTLEVYKKVYKAKNTSSRTLQDSGFKS